jgi:hypothetical protein
LILVAFPFAAAGANPYFEISPYVQNVEGTSTTISWKPVGGVTGRVEYGATTAYGALAEGHIEYVMKNSVPQPKKGSVVRSQLIGLLPDTLYHYRVVLPSSANEDRRFRTPTADPNAPFTFLVYGDSRSDPLAHARVVSGAAATCNPAFVLTTGDVVPSSGSSQAVWISQFFVPADPLLGKTWLLVTRGNHDATSQLLSLYFEAPGDGRVKDYYSFDWGPVHVVTINTNRDYQPGSEQYRFLEQDLASTPRPFKVFFGHHPAYSSAFHGSTKKVQIHLQPLFEAHGVQLVFAGHDHSYERTIVNSITYVVSGGGGAPLHGQRQLGKNPDSLVFRKAYHFIEVNVTAATLTLTAWAVNNADVATVADHVVIEP